MADSLPRAIRTIVTAGLVAGVLDISYVFIYFSSIPPDALLRGIAAGLLGPNAAQGGLGTAVVGLAVHLSIATWWAAVFYGLSRQWPMLLRNPWIVGPLYGVVVWLLMYLVVLPYFSANPPTQFPGPRWLPILIAHLTCVGLPIALITRRMAPPPAPPDR